MPDGICHQYRGDCTTCYRTLIITVEDSRIVGRCPNHGEIWFFNWPGGPASIEEVNAAHDAAALARKAEKAAKLEAQQARDVLAAMGSAGLPAPAHDDVVAAFLLPLSVSALVRIEKVMSAAHGPGLSVRQRGPWLQIVKPQPVHA